MRRNAELVLDPGNQFGSLSGSSPYFGIPSWWRRFLFRVLSQRDLTVYAYLCSLMDQNDICYPTTRQIAEEVGVDSPTTIFNALAKLEQLGFIIRERRRLPGRVYKFQRNIYQRPAPEFTLKTLLDQGKIDGKLRPLSPATLKANVTDVTGRSDRAVEAGLRNLLRDKYSGYDEAREDEKTPALRVLLDERLDDRRAEMAPKASEAADASKQDTGVVIDGKKFRAREVFGAAAGAEGIVPSFSIREFQPRAASADEAEEVEDEIPF